MKAWSRSADCHQAADDVAVATLQQTLQQTACSLIQVHCIVWGPHWGVGSIVLHCNTLVMCKRQKKSLLVTPTLCKKNGKDVEICSHGTLQQLQRCAHAAERLVGEEEEQQGRVVHPDGGNCLFHFFSHHFFAVYLRYRKQCTQPGG